MTKYSVTIGDYNDVYSRDEMDFDNWDHADQYAFNYITQNGYKRDEIEDIGTTGICLAVYCPVVDDNGNEVSQEDPRYDELNEEQDLRIKLYVEIQEIDDQ